MNKYDKCVQYILENQNSFYRIAYCNIHNEYDAQDIVQNSIIKALENINSLKNGDAIRTWFYRILINECIDHIKKGRHETVAELYDTSESAYTENFYEPNDELLSALLGISQENRSVILLHIYEELTLKETAAVLNIPLSTVKSRYYAGIEQLKKRLAGNTERKIS